MMSALSQIEATHLEQWLKILFWLCGGIAAVLIIVDRLTGKHGKREIQSPLEVRAAADLVPRAEHEKHMSEIKAELGRHAARRAEIYDMQSEQGGEVKALQAHVDGLKATVAKVEAKLDSNTNLTARIDGRIDQINQNVSNLTASVTQFMRDQANKPNKRHDG